MVLLSCLVTLIFSFLVTVQCIDTSVKGDTCSNFDLCSESRANAFRTCSCDEDCYKYEICCVDAENFHLMSSQTPEYQCYGDRAVTPVFAKRTCAEKFMGHVDHKVACMNTEPDKADVLGNLLVTSSKTRITYWNKDCGICNYEKTEDLTPWTVQVTCPRMYNATTYNSTTHDLIEIRQKHIRNNLTFNWNEEKWGLKLGDEFINCSVNMHQPGDAVGRLRYCAPNLIDSCPLNHTDIDMVKRCSMFHGERKLKDTNFYFKNVHCGLCNGASLKEMVCVGRNYAPKGLPSGHNIVKLIFHNQEWLKILGSERYKCSKGFGYDPFWQKCRRRDLESSDKISFILNSAQTNVAKLLVLIASVFVATRVLFLGI